MTQPPDCILAVDDVAFSYRGGPSVVRGMRLNLAAKERVALMGASGSGKTTLLKVIAGFSGYSPTNGNIVREGRFAMVFQQPLLLNHLNVRENINLPARLRGTTVSNGHVTHVLGLERLMERYPYQLSGGQQRRVALARAMLFPDVQGLIMDEPFTGLDEPLRDQILNEIHVALEETGLACLFTTHSPLEAAILADRVVFMGGQPASNLFEQTILTPHAERVQQLDHQGLANEVANLRIRLRTITKAPNSTGLPNIST